MIAHKIDIDGTIYGNIANITTEIEEVPYHDVTALDGTSYYEVRYTKTHHTAQFYNILDGVYQALKNFVKTHKGQPVSVGFPDDADGFEYSEYYLTITGGEINKGYLRDNYYRTGVVVNFKKVNADE